MTYQNNIYFAQKSLILKHSKEWVSSTVYQLNTHSYKETIINLALTEGTNHTTNQCIKLLKANDKPKRKETIPKTPNTLSPSVKLQYHRSSGIHLWIYVHTDQDTCETKQKEKERKYIHTMKAQSQLIIFKNQSSCFNEPKYQRVGLIDLHNRQKCPCFHPKSSNTRGSSGSAPRWPHSQLYAQDNETVGSNSTQNSTLSEKKVQRRYNFVPRGTKHIIVP